MSNIVITAIVMCMTEAEHKYIRETVRSVCAQTCPCHVVVYVSEGDKSIEKVLGDLASSVKIRRVKLLPPGLIRNTGTKEASTKWVAFLDGDDIWMPRKLEIQLAHAVKNNLSAVGCRHLLVREDGKPFFFGFAKSHPMPSSWLAERDLLIKFPFNDWRQAEDIELWRRLEEKSGVATIKQYLLKYRVRKASTSTGTYWKERKYLFAKISHYPAARFLLLVCSRTVAAFVSSPTK